MLGGYLTRLMALYSACKVCNYKYKFRRLYRLREMNLMSTSHHRAECVDHRSICVRVMDEMRDNPVDLAASTRKLCSASHTC